MVVLYLLFQLKGVILHLKRSCNILILNNIDQSIYKLYLNINIYLENQVPY